jgi:acetolactate synthase-1/2/3 large subunit
MKTVAEQIADWLVRNNIDQVFTVTGGGAMFLNQALGGHPSLNCTFMHHEQACAMAAEGYARITGRPAVTMLTTGPGSINALNGVYGAFTDSIPMIVISGQVKRETCLGFHDLPELRQLGDQEGPTIAMAKPVCKFAQLIRTPSDLAQALPKAYRTAITGRPGPVWLDIPLDIQSSTEPIDIPDNDPPTPYSGKVNEPCRKALEALLKAHRPILLCGTGVRLAGATDRLLQFAEHTGIPVATAWTHDLIHSNHPLYAGRPGTIGTRAGNFCLQNSDFVLVIGSRLNIRQISYNWNSFAKNAFIVHVDIDSAEFNKPTVKPHVTIEADASEFLETISQLIEDLELPDYSSWVDWCREISHRFDVSSGYTQTINAPLNPYLAVEEIFRLLREDDIIVCGNASACIIPFQVGRLKRYQRMFSNSGSASMGHDLPAAIGAAMADKTRKQRVICFAGDGSLQMNIQELQTLKTYGLNIIVIVLNNNGYLSIRLTHENFFGRIIGANPESGVEFPDFSKVASAYGIRSSRIEQMQSIEPLLNEDGPLLLDIIVDPAQEFEPRIKSRVDESGKFITPELDDMYPFIDANEISAIRLSATQVISKKKSISS